MNYKYRVKGKVVGNFILKGNLSSVGENVDILIYENELDFISKKLTNIEIINIDKDNNLSESIPIENNKEETSNDRHRTNKNKNKRKV